MEHIEKAVKKAAEAAKAAPEKLRERAFATVLEHLLRESGSTDVERGGRGSERVDGARPTRRQGGGPTEELEARLPSLEHVENWTRAQQAVWAVITLDGRGDEAMVANIRKAIRTELAVEPQNEQNTGRTLRELTPTYVERRERPDGRGYVYRPKPKALEIFEDLEG